MNNRDQRELRNGAGDAFAKAFEMIATPAIFGLGGWFIDSRFDLFPLVTLLTVLVVFSYQLWRFLVDYNTAMDNQLEQRRASYTAPSSHQLDNRQEQSQETGRA